MVRFSWHVEEALNITGNTVPAMALLVLEPAAAGAGGIAADFLRARLRPPIGLCQQGHHLRSRPRRTPTKRG